jgi:hypothetical protein
MVTGLDLSKLFEDKIDNSYSDYVSDAKMQRAFDNAFLRIIENKYRGMDTQKEFDELSELMVIDEFLLINNNRFRTTPVPIASATAAGVFTFSAEHNLIVGDQFTVEGPTGYPNLGDQFTVVTVTSPTIVDVVTPITAITDADNGSIVTVAQTTGYRNMLGDYLHVLAIKAYMYDNDDSVEIYKAYGGTPVVIEFFRPVKLRSKDYLHAGGFQNLQTDTGFRVVKQISEFKYELYLPPPKPPANFNTPVTLSQADAESIGEIKRVAINWAKYLQSDRRISKSGEPSIDEPRFNQHKNFILMHPQRAVSRAVSVDYIRKPEVVIDVTDNVRDLNLFYSETLLNRLTDEAVKMFYQEVRDPNQYQIADREMLDNP